VSGKRLSALFEQEPLIAEGLGTQGGLPGDLRASDRPQAEQQLERFLTGCRLAAIPPFDAFAEGIRLWRQELLARFD
jgi:hypothetical protein